MNGNPWYVGREQVERLLDHDLAIASQRLAFQVLDEGTGELPGKVMHASRFDGSVAFAYLARLSAHSGVAAKVGTVQPANAARGLPAVSAVINLFDPGTGRLAAILDGDVITARRTAAASAVAIDALALPESAELGIIGSGQQALAHARAIARVRELRAIRTSSRPWSVREIGS